MGNICRSPVAEGILQHLSQINNLDIEIDSAGTISMHQGNAPDERSTANASKHGVDISKQQSRPIKLHDFDYYDKIFVMDVNNYNALQRLTSNKNRLQKVDFLLNISYPNQNKNVPDPYYGEGDGFETVYQLIFEACSKLVDELKM